MKKMFIIIALLTIILFNNQTNDVIIPNESIRFRVIPNSNSLIDINIKEQVKEEVERTIIQNSNVNNIEEERMLITNNLSTLENNINNILKSNNYDKSFKVNYGLNYFPEKEYENKKYSEGYYESLVIEIGEAKGDNYWCVLFPPFCLMEVEKQESNDIEYTTFIGNIFNKIFN